MYNNINPTIGEKIVILIPTSPLRNKFRTIVINCINIIIIKPFCFHFNNIQYPINKTIEEKSQTNLNQTGSGVADHNPLEENINNKYPIAAKPLTIKHSHNQKDIKPLRFNSFVSLLSKEFIVFYLTCIINNLLTLQNCFLSRISNLWYLFEILVIR